jgi:hypothetical protein
MAEKLADDLLVGAKALAEYTGLTERQIFHLADTRQLPIFKIGHKLAARKSTLTQHMAALERGEGAAA